VGALSEENGAAEDVLFKEIIVQLAELDESIRLSEVSDATKLYGVGRVTSYIFTLIERHLAKSAN
jgi:hypothetical protein